MIIAAIGEQSDLEEGGMDLTLKAMRRPLEALGYEVTGMMPVLGIFDKGEIEKRQRILDEAKKLGRRLAHEVEPA